MTVQMPAAFRFTRPTPGAKNWAVYATATGEFLGYTTPVERRSHTRRGHMQTRPWYTIADTLDRPMIDGEGYSLYFATREKAAEELAYEATKAPSARLPVADPGAALAAMGASHVEDLNSGRVLHHEPQGRIVVAHAMGRAIEAHYAAARAWDYAPGFVMTGGNRPAVNPGSGVGGLGNGPTYHNEHRCLADCGADLCLRLRGEGLTLIGIGQPRPMNDPED